MYEEHSPSSLELLSRYAAPATLLHDLLQGTPQRVYYRLDWKQTWLSLQQALEPWLQFSSPLAIEDGAQDAPGSP